MIVTRISIQLKSNCIAWLFPHVASNDLQNVMIFRIRLGFEISKNLWFCKNLNFFSAFVHPTLLVVQGYLSIQNHFLNHLLSYFLNLSKLVCPSVCLVSSYRSRFLRYFDEISYIGLLWLKDERKEKVMVRIGPICPSEHYSIPLFRKAAIWTKLLIDMV